MIINNLTNVTEDVKHVPFRFCSEPLEVGTNARTIAHKKGKTNKTAKPKPIRERRKQEDYFLFQTIK